MEERGRGKNLCAFLIFPPRIMSRSTPADTCVSFYYLLTVGRSTMLVLSKRCECHTAQKCQIIRFLISNGKWSTVWPNFHIGRKKQFSLTYLSEIAIRTSWKAHTRTRIITESPETKIIRVPPVVRKENSRMNIPTFRGYIRREKNL